MTNVTVKRNGPGPSGQGQQRVDPRQVMERVYRMMQADLTIARERE